MKHINKKHKDNTVSDVNTNSDADKSLISVSAKANGKEDGSSFKKILTIFILITFIMLIAATAYYQKSQTNKDFTISTQIPSRLVINRTFEVGKSFVYEKKKIFALTSKV